MSNKEIDKRINKVIHDVMKLIEIRGQHPEKRSRITDIISRRLETYYRLNDQKTILTGGHL